ncbi:MAG: cellulose synthase operon protein YhjQ/BcsQ, partial [Terracidiphilus sp.]
QQPYPERYPGQAPMSLAAPQPAAAPQPISPMPPAAPYYPAPQPEYPPYPQAQPFRAAAPAPQYPPAYPQPREPQYPAAREENYPQPRSPWAPAEPREPIGRPAWLQADRPESAVVPQLPPAPQDTLQGSRDRLTSRWFALKGVFEGASPAPVEAPPPPAPSRAPVLAVFSLAGGVGKTSLVATLGRALSARGERVLLVDTAAYGLLPFYFGARDQRPGQLRTFSPPGTSGDAPIQMVTVDPDSLAPDAPGQENLTQEIQRYARSASRVIIDLATASGATTRRVMRMSPTILVPVVPDMNSVVSVGSIDAFFKHSAKATGKQVVVYYVLNQFDPSLPLHLDVREVLREQLGDRLLPFALRRAPAVSEALAEGMTVMDYAPNSTVAEDFGSLAAWVKSLAAPATTGYRGVRWSER